MLKYFCLTLVLSGLYFTTFINYLLFHSIVEIISIVVACSFFMIAWNSKKYIHNQYVLFIGIAYLFIAFLDLLHTLSYKGMPIFMDYDYYANQLWIAARYMESVTLVVAFYFLGTKKTFHPEKIFAVYTMITAGIVASIFVWKIFPVCFIEGSGLTPFKKISEYIISGILCVSIVLLQKNKNRFEDHIHKMLFFSIVFTILSELAFTFYISNYGFSNLIGHYFK
ncbi:MAG: hybrid sensor histidine kinase/response regulator, partial [Proteobacteria bacterium]|nr:hybrid sensor histidine kinase/response regulator [Pseudomonadota bacterium]